MQLQANHLLQGGKYRIIKSLGQGGFGITYLAEQTMMDRKVCIKEFFLKDYCDRDESTSQVSLGTTNNRALMQKYQEKFLKEARMIAKLDHPNIIRIHDVFTENNTAYYVMDYIEGTNLNDIVKQRGALPEAEAIGIIKAVGEGLAYVHERKITHLDVKPGNIMIRKEDGRPVLIDFGMSKQYDESGEQTSSTPVGVSAGYAPLEQYQVGGVTEFSPQTDIYALGATLYRLVTGQVPPQASDVMNEGLPEMTSSISETTRLTIEKAMEFRKKNRPSNVHECLVILNECDNSLDSKTPVCHPNYEESDSTYLVSSEDETCVVDAEVTHKENKILDIIEMISIDGGTFTMGSKGWVFSSNSSPDETPQHLVTLSDFSISKFQITQKIWKQVMGSNPSIEVGDDLPVENVSWNDVQTFISILNGITGRSFRLPTEAEWEFVAKNRGGSNNKYAGNDSLFSVGWCKENSGLQTHPVGQMLPSELGIYDLCGNVWEWCQDGFQKYEKNPSTNPCITNDRIKVLRGGSCATEEWKCRVTSRASAEPDYKSKRYGFRLAHSKQ